MIKLQPDALYTIPEVVKILGWNIRTVQRAARRLGIKPYTKFFAAEDVRRMATRGN